MTSSVLLITLRALVSPVHVLRFRIYYSQAPVPLLTCSRSLSLLSNIHLAALALSRAGRRSCAILFGVALSNGCCRAHLMRLMRHHRHTPSDKLALAVSCLLDLLCAPTRISALTGDGLNGSFRCTRQLHMPRHRTAAVVKSTVTSRMLMFRHQNPLISIIPRSRPCAVSMHRTFCSRRAAIL